MKNRIKSSFLLILIWILYFSCSKNKISLEEKLSMQMPYLKSVHTRDCVFKHVNAGTIGEFRKINIDSIIGKNQIPVIAKVKGTSMFPTLQDGQQVLINKTHNIHIGDIVVANSSEYGGIIKRVSDINGDDVYLTSDNRDITYEYINNSLYEVKGITAWVNINDINGVVIEY